MPKRRANHEGTIYKRQDGRWVASVTLPGGKRKSFYGQTRQEVAQKLTVGLKARLDGVPLPSEQLKVGRYLQDWLESARPGLRYGSWRRYAQLLRLHVIPSLGHLPLARISPHHLQQLYAQRLAQGLAPTTVRQLHAVLRRSLGQAEQWGLVARNVATLVIPPRRSRREITPLSAGQAKALLEAAHGERLEAIYVLALTTGMRRGELLALRWQDIDLAAGALHVQHTLVRTPQGLQLTEPKTPRSRRRIALSTIAVAALHRQKRHQAMERLRLGPAWKDQGIVFANDIGRPIEAGNLLRRSFWPLLDKAALPRVRFHDLRHTAATLLLQQGVHVKVVSELLGHSSVGMTLDVYCHVIPDMQHAAATAMDQLLRL